MKDFVSNKKIFYFVLLISVFVFFPLWFSVYFFVQKTTDELVRAWFNSEQVSIQQGNILSSVTKFQRNLSDSYLLKAVKVTDNAGKVLIEFSKDNRPNDFNLYPVNHHQLQPYQLGLTERVYFFSNGVVNFYILTGSGLPLYFLVILSFYLSLVLSFAYFFIKKETLFFERINSEQEKKELERKIELSEKIRFQAEKLSHDIRSPLAALNSVLQDIKIDGELSWIVRKSIERINFIAENLLIKNKADSLSLSFYEFQDISTAVTELIKEKKAEFSYLPNFQINQTNTQAQGYIQTNILELKSGLSNVINNSIDAMFPTKGLRIDISIFLNEKFLFIKIKDNGRGIPESIIPHLGTLRFSYGKDKSQNSGSGLGLYELKGFINVCAGVFRIVSNQSKDSGTMIELGFPVFSELPILESLEMYDLILIDDDKLIRTSWSLRAAKRGKTIKLFSSVDEFLIHHEKLSRKSAIYIDSNLGTDSSGNEIKGESYVKAIHELGFKKIFMSTGYEQDSFQRIDNLTGVVGKSPDFI